VSMGSRLAAGCWRGLSLRRCGRFPVPPELCRSVDCCPGLAVARRRSRQIRVEWFRSSCCLIGPGILAAQDDSSGQGSIRSVDCWQVGSTPRKLLTLRWREVTWLSSQSTPCHAQGCESLNQPCVLCQLGPPVLQNRRANASHSASGISVTSSQVIV
jgi:hypothetical protein